MIEWSEAASELAGFIGSFLAVGAIGFRFVAGRVRTTSADESAVMTSALHRAAKWGFAGAVLGVILFALAAPEIAARQHTTVAHALTGGALQIAQLVLFALGLAGFLLAVSRISIGWPLAAIGIIVNPLRAAFTGQFARLVNPLHRLGAGFWIGTLFILVVAGLVSILRSTLPSDRRGVLAESMVNAFSSLALVSSAVLVVFGVTTAWRHLKTLHALWTTPYGYAFLVKLAFVALVVALGAWNWRRQRPLLGSEEAAHALKKSATAELAVAAIVLVITAILVSLPSPAQEKRPPRPAAQGTAVPK